MTRPLYDWPCLVKPEASLLRAVGAVQDGFISRAEYANDVGIPGARLRLQMEFHTLSNDAIDWYSWLLSKLKGSVFRVPLWQSPQIARPADLGISAAVYNSQIPFNTNGTEVLFSDGAGFEFTPTLDVAAGGLEGDVSLTIDETRYPGILRVGKFIGVGMGAYMVEDIDRTSGNAAVTITPQLRRDVIAGELVSLRPRVICQPGSIESFEAMFRYGRWVQPGALTLTEVVDERFL